MYCDNIERVFYPYLFSLNEGVCEIRDYKMNIINKTKYGNRTIIKNIEYEIARNGQPQLKVSLNCGNWRPFIRNRNTENYNFIADNILVDFHIHHIDERVYYIPKTLQVAYTKTSLFGAEYMCYQLIRLITPIRDIANEIMYWRLWLIIGDLLQY
jgi:hypothetical protein